MPDQALVLGSLAAVLHISAYLAYARQMRNKTSEPNPASWVIWLGIVTFNAFVYREVSGSFIAAAQFFAGIIGCGYVCIVVLRAGKLAQLKAHEHAVLAICACGFAAWFVFGSAETAGYIILAAVAVSSEPTIRGVWDDPQKERPLPWLLWALGFATTACAAALRPDARLIELLIPGLSLCVDATIVYLTVHPRRRSLCPITPNEHRP